MDAPTLTTERLTLRAMAMEDWAPYAAMWADPQVTTYIGGTPRPRDLAWTKFAQGAGFWSLLGYGFWAVIDRGTGGFLGVGGPAQFERGIDELVGYPEFGWAYAAESWGRGIAGEALAAMLGWADSELGGEFRCLIDNANAASVKVAMRNGFQPCADLPDAKRVFRRPAPSSRD